jgi:hypothetical protein
LADQDKDAWAFLAFQSQTTFIFYSYEYSIAQSCVSHGGAKSPNSQSSTFTTSTLGLSLTTLRASSGIGSTKLSELSVMDGVGGMMLCGLAVAATKGTGEDQDMGTEEEVVVAVEGEEDGMEETAVAEMEEEVMGVEAAEVNKMGLGSMFNLFSACS